MVAPKLRLSYRHDVYIDLVVYPGVDELDVFGPLRVLRTAARRGIDFTVRTVTRCEPTPIVTSFGVQFQPDARYQQGADVLIVPGGGWGTRAEAGAWGEAHRGDWLPLLAEANETSQLLAGVCTGTMLLAHAGAITGRRANTHHSAINDLADLGVRIVDERVVDDGDLITSGGVTAGIDLALHLVERLAGTNHAEAIAANLEYRTVT